MRVAQLYINNNSTLWPSKTYLIYIYLDNENQKTSLWNCICIVLCYGPEAFILNKDIVHYIHTCIYIYMYIYIYIYIYTRLQ